MGKNPNPFSLGYENSKGRIPLAALEHAWMKFATPSLKQAI
jgi:hypothetical protein